MLTMSKLKTDYSNIQMKQEQRTVHYRLLRLTYGQEERYCISVRCEKDRKSYLMPVCDIGRARAVFRSIVAGTVTPVTLCDVIEDLLL